MPLSSSQFLIVAWQLLSTLLTVSFMALTQQCAPGKLTILDCSIVPFFNITTCIVYDMDKAMCP